LTDKLPDVLSVEEVGRLLDAAPGAKYKAALGTAYGAGLRGSEIAALKIDDIDSTRMLIRVEQGSRAKFDDPSHSVLQPLSVNAPQGSVQAPISGAQPGHPAPST
jgi:integrase